MAKITLNKKEKQQLTQDGKMTISRECYLSAPKTSIIHGKGIGSIFDKIDYRWVYGDTADYIKTMMNVGRRKDDYPNNTKSTNSGSHWYDFPDNIQDEFGVQGSVFKSGRKDPTHFQVTDICVSELRPTADNKYLRIVMMIDIKLGIV